MRSSRLALVPLTILALALLSAGLANPASAGDKPKVGPQVVGSGTVGPFSDGTQIFYPTFSIFAETEQNTTDFSTSVPATGKYIQDAVGLGHFEGDVICVLFHSGDSITVGGNINPASTGYSPDGPYLGFVAFVELAPTGQLDHLEVYGTRFQMFPTSCFQSDQPIRELIASGDIDVLPGKKGQLPW